MKSIHELYHQRSIRISEIIHIDCTKLNVNILRAGHARRIIWHLYNDQYDIPVCLHKSCNNDAKWQKSYYGKYCSKKCSASDPIVINKSKQTNLKKYGVEHAMHDPIKKHKAAKKRENTNLSRYGHKNPFGNKDIQKKAANTIQKKYGVNNVFQSDSIKNQIKITNQKKYGVDYYSQSTEYTEKTIRTNQKKYGVDYPSQNLNMKKRKEQTFKEKYGGYFHQSDTLSTKIHQSNLKKFGVKNPLSSNKIRNKRNKTMTDKYGCINPMDNDDIKTHHKNVMSSAAVQAKKRKTMLNKWGVDNYQYVHILPEHIAILQDPDKFIKFCENKTISQISNEMNIHPSTIYHKIIKFKCASKINIKKDISVFEKSVIEFVSTFNLEIQLNTRSIISPYEIDIFFPELNIGIECNGDYWHSDIFKDRTYHYKKWSRCYDKNIRLISISESEWFNKTKLYKDMLIVALQQVKTSIGARHSIITKINSKIAKDFLNNNHLQGFAQGTSHYGAYIKKELVGVMTFGWTRGTVLSRRFELKRWATKSDIIISGLFSKIFKHAHSDLKFNKVISFSDNKWFMGGLYASNNFKKSCIYGPNYQYYYNKQVFHKQHFMKSNLCKKFPHIKESIDNGMTELEAVRKLGILRIWDCGKTEWTWVSYDY
jgi:hypothetical protein